VAVVSWWTVSKQTVSKQSENECRTAAASVVYVSGVWVHYAHAVRGRRVRPTATTARTAAATPPPHPPTFCCCLLYIVGLPKPRAPRLAVNPAPHLRGVAQELGAVRQGRNTHSHPVPEIAAVIPLAESYLKGAQVEHEK